MTEQLLTSTRLADVLEQIAATLRQSELSPATEDGKGDPQSTSEVSDPEDPSQTITEAPGRPPAATPAPGPRSWTEVGQLQVQPNSWSAAQHQYDGVEVWETDDEGVPHLQFLLGYVAADPGRDWYGHPRGWWVVREMVNRRLGSELAVFVEADQPTDLVAIIRGNGPNGRSMFDPGEELPAGYENLTVDVFRDRVIGPQAYGKLAVVAVDGNRQSMLNHAAIQWAR